MPDFGILWDVMEQQGERDPVRRRTCPNCGASVLEFTLHTCAICRSLCCQACGVEDFGRVFCSMPCRDYFFHGDDDTDVVSDEE